MQRICKDCGQPFEAANKHQRLCPLCAASARAGSVIRTRTCRQCGQPFEGGPRAWYCPDCRRDRQLARDRQHKRNRSIGLPHRPLGSTDHCAACGKPYVVEGGNQRYCKACAPIQTRLHDSQTGLKRYHAIKDTYNPIRNQRRRLTKDEPHEPAGATNKKDPPG